jgi:hypothetical protein
LKKQKSFLLEEVSKRESGDNSERLSSGISEKQARDFLLLIFIQFPNKNIVDASCVLLDDLNSGATCSSV